MRNLFFRKDSFEPSRITFRINFVYAKLNLIFAHLRRRVNCNSLTMRISLAALGKGRCSEGCVFWMESSPVRSRLFFLNSVFQRQPLICWMKNSRVIKLRRLIGLMRRWTRPQWNDTPLYSRSRHVGKFIRKILRLRCVSRRGIAKV